MEEQETKVIFDYGKEKMVKNNIEYSLFCIRDEKGIAENIANGLRDLHHKVLVETHRNSRKTLYKVWWQI